MVWFHGLAGFSFFFFFQQQGFFIEDVATYDMAYNFSIVVFVCCPLTRKLEGKKILHHTIVFLQLKHCFFCHQLRVKNSFRKKKGPSAAIQVPEGEGPETL